MPADPHFLAPQELENPANQQTTNPFQEEANDLPQEEATNPFQEEASDLPSDQSTNESLIGDMLNESNQSAETGTTLDLDRVLTPADDSGFGFHPIYLLFLLPLLLIPLYFFVRRRQAKRSSRKTLLNHKPSERTTGKFREKIPPRFGPERPEPLPAARHADDANVSREAAAAREELDLASLEPESEFASDDDFGVFDFGRDENPADVAPVSSTDAEFAPALELADGREPDLQHSPDDEDFEFEFSDEEFRFDTSQEIANAPAFPVTAAVGESMHAERPIESMEPVAVQDLGGEPIVATGTNAFPDDNDEFEFEDDDFDMDEDEQHAPSQDVAASNTADLPAMDATGPEPPRDTLGHSDHDSDEFEFEDDVDLIEDSESGFVVEIDHTSEVVSTPKVDREKDDLAPAMAETELDYDDLQLSDSELVLDDESGKQLADEMESVEHVVSHEYAPKHVDAHSNTFSSSEGAASESVMAELAALKKQNEQLSKKSADLRVQLSDRDLLVSQLVDVKLPELESELETLKAQVAKAATQKTRLLESLDAAAAEKSQLADVNAQLPELNSELETLRVQLAEAATQKTRLQESLDAEAAEKSQLADVNAQLVDAKLPELNSELETLRAQLTEAATQKTRLQESLDAAAAEKTKLADVNAQLVDAKLPELTSELETLRAQLTEAATQKSRMQDSLDAAAAEKSQLADVNAQLVDAKLPELNSELETLRAQLTEAATQKSRMQDSLDAAAAEKTKLADVNAQLVDAKLPELNSELETLRAQLAEAATQKTRLQESLDAAAAEKSQLADVNAQLVDAKLPELTSELETLRAQLTEAATQKARMQELLDAAAAEKTKLADVNAQLVDAKLPELNSELETLRAQLTEAATQKSRMQELLDAAAAEKTKLAEDNAQLIDAKLPELTSELETLRAQMQELLDAAAAEKSSYEDRLADVNSKLETARQEVEIARSEVPQEAEQQWHEKIGLLERDLIKQQNQSEAIFKELTEARKELTLAPALADTDESESTIALRLKEKSTKLRMVKAKLREKLILAKTMQTELDSANAELNNLRETSESQADLLQTNDKLHDEIGDLKAQLAKVKNEAERQQVQREEESGQLRERLEQLELEKATVDGQLETTRAALDESAQLKIQLAEAAELNVQIEELRATMAKQQEQLLAAESTVPETVEKELVSLRESVRQSTTHKINFEKADAENQRLSTEIKALKDAAASAESVFQQRLAKHEEQVIANYVAQVPVVDTVALEKQLHDLKSANQSLVSRVTEAGRIVADARSEKDEAVRIAEEKQRNISRLESDRRKLELEINAAQAIIADSGSQSARIEDLESQVDQQTREIRRLKRQVANVGSSKKPAEKKTLTRKTSAKQKTTAGKKDQKTSASGSRSRGEKTTDDLKQIVGIGPVYEKRLNKAGINTFEQIANWTKAEVAVYELRFDASRISDDNWVAQAKKLAKKTKKRK